MFVCVVVSRSPPRPSPGGLHYSDEDICNNYNGAVLTESTTLTEKPTEVSESEVALSLSHSLSVSVSLKFKGFIGLMGKKPVQFSSLLAHQRKLFLQQGSLKKHKHKTWNINTIKTHKDN